MNASAKNFFDKKKKKKKGAATARWRCNALQVFLTKKTTMIVSVSETKKEAEEEFCEE